MKKNLLLSIFIFTILLPGILFAKHNTGKRLFEKSSDRLTLVCESPCPFTKKNLEKAFKTLDRDFRRLEASTKIALPDSEKPFEVHLRYDTTCKENYSKPAIRKEIWAFSKNFNDGRGLICLKKPEIQDVIEGQSYFLHELAHHYSLIEQTGDFGLVEDITDTLLNPLIKGRKSLCDDVNRKYRPRIYKLCAEDGLDFKDLPALAARFLELRTQRKTLTEQEAIQEIRKITKAN